MHRSGTSAITRVINLLGYALPRSLLGDNESNPVGHWESTEVIALNEEILRSAGTGWDDWTPFNEGWYETPLAAGYLERARHVIRSEFAGEPMFVLKDPRICRIAPLWFRALDSEGIEARVVLPIRHPVEVSTSLHKRDLIRVEYGKLLWLRYVLDAERVSRERSRFLFAYDQLLADWPLVVEQMAKELGWAWARSSAEVNQAIDAFLSPRHRRQVLHELGTRGHDAWTRSTLEVLERWTKTSPDPAGEAVLDQIRNSFDCAAPTFAELLMPARDSRTTTDGRARKPADELAPRSAVPEMEEQVALLNEEERGTAEESEEANAEPQAPASGFMPESPLIGDEPVAGAATSQTHVELLGLIEIIRSAQDEIRNQAERRAEQLTAEIRTREQKIAELESNLRQRQEEIAHAWLELEREKAARQSAEQTAAELKESEQRVEHLTRLMRASEADAERRAEQLTAEVRTREQKIAELESNLRQRQEENAQAWLELEREKAARQSAEQTAAELKKSEQRVERLTRLMRDSQAQKNRLRNELQGLRGEVKNLNSQLADKDSALAAANEQHRITKRTAALLQSECEEALQRVAAVEYELTAAKSEAGNLTKELQAATSDLDAARQSIDERFAELASMTRILIDEETERKNLEAQSRWLRQVNEVVMRKGKWWWQLLPREGQRRMRLRQLAREGLFDADAYLRAYPDVASSGLDPLRHYVAHGLDEQRHF